MASRWVVVLQGPAKSSDGDVPWLFVFKPQKNKPFTWGACPKLNLLGFFLGMENGIASFFRKAHAFLNIYGPLLPLVSGYVHQNTPWVHLPFRRSPGPIFFYQVRSTLRTPRKRTGPRNYWVFHSQPYLCGGGTS